MADNQHVSLKQLAAQLGMDRSQARKYVLKLGYTPSWLRTSDSGGQRSLVVTTDEAEAIIATRLHDYGDPVSGSSGQPTPDHGFFYIIQLVPELDPRRVKLGFAVSVEERLSQHRTAAPTATCLRVWPCKRIWELPAIDCLVHDTARLILNEVYECEGVDALVQKAEAFFALMPTPNGRPILADCSPLKLNP